ncbi:MFS general substrate transporter [Xylaria scruposa]|nr:MFS general substrate transporter [Xylaria scruposa]
MLGDNLQPDALIHVFEAVICDEYYKTHLVPATVISNATSPVFDFVPLFAALLCTVPYGLLAERIGRKRVLILSDVCYFRFAPIRWVLLSGIFLFIGGGDAVTSSVIRVMVTDATNRAELLILADVTLFSGTFILTQLIPETLNMNCSRKAFSALGPMDSHPVTPSAGYRLSYARSNLLLALFQGAQGLLIVVLRPLATGTIANPSGWTPWSRDRRYAISSIVITAFGLLVIGLAPAVAVEIIGLLLMAFGSCTTGLLTSPLSITVRLSQVSAVYSAALMLSLVSRSVVGPVASAAKGLNLGWIWMGLPFATMAILMVGVSLVSGFIRKEKGVTEE